MTSNYDRFLETVVLVIACLFALGTVEVSKSANASQTSEPNPPEVKK
jgi:hypothetical protein